MPAATERCERRAQIRKTELIASNSQKTKRVMKSPAKTAPRALPAYTTAEVCCSVGRSPFFRCSE